METSSPTPEVPTRRRTIYALIGVLVFLLCLAYLVRVFQWREALDLLAKGNAVLFLAGGSLTIVVYWFVRAVRWYVLLRFMKLDAPFGLLYLVNSVALSLAVMTPMQSGEALKVEYLKHSGALNRLPGYGAFLLERTMDIGVIAVLALVGLALNPHVVAVSKGVYAVLLVVIIGLGAVVALAHLASVRGRARGFVRDITACCRDIRGILALLLLTGVSWGIVAISWSICLASISVNLSPSELAALLSIVTLVNLAACIPGGLGISEVSITELLVRMGHGTVSAQGGALVLRAYGLLILALGLVHYVLWQRLSFARGPGAPGSSSDGSTGAPG